MADILDLMSSMGMLTNPFTGEPMGTPPAPLDMAPDRGGLGEIGGVPNASPLGRVISG